MKFSKELLRGALAAGIMTACSLPAAPLGTAFTYQGRLEQNGQPANGSFVMSFGLYDTPAPGGSLIGQTNMLTVGVTNGLFTTDLDFGANAFAGEARWLETAVSTNNGGSFTTLLPRTRVSPTPNAIFAATAGAAATVVNGVVVKSLNGLQDNVTLTPGANITLTPSGNNLQISASGTIGSLSLPYAGTASSASALFQVNNLGISATSEGIVGTTASMASQATAVRGTATGSSGAVIGVSGVATSSPDGTGIVGVGGITGGYFSATRPGGRAAYCDGNVIVNTGSLLVNSGNVGIGTAVPDAALEVVANWDGGRQALKLSGNKPTIMFAGDAVSGNQTWRMHLGSDGSGNLQFYRSSDLVMALTTPAYSNRVEIYGQNALGLVGYQPFLTLLDDNAGYARGRIQSVSGSLTLETEGFINGSRPNAYAALDGQGNFAVATLTIRGGADLAEPFPMKEETIEKGSVVVIDEDHPGQLKLSTRAYDTRVAGIVSGAHGISPGIALKQEGALDQGQNVALTGRVYVQADASFGTIQPGDLLTTSDTPGHAMKVTDHARAQGAILGKAMSALNGGRGLVLVLVTLQ